MKSAISSPRRVRRALRPKIGYWCTFVTAQDELVVGLSVGYSEHPSEFGDWLSVFLPDLAQLCEVHVSKVRIFHEKVTLPSTLSAPSPTDPRSLLDDEGSWYHEDDRD